MKTLVLPQETTILKGGYFLSQNCKKLKEINLLYDLFWLWHALCYFQLHIRQLHIYTLPFLTSRVSERLHFIPVPCSWTCQVRDITDLHNFSFKMRIFIGLKFFKFVCVRDRETGREIYSEQMCPLASRIISQY